MFVVIITEQGYETEELAGLALTLDAGELRAYVLPEPEDCDPDTYPDMLFRAVKGLNPDVIIMPELPHLSGAAPALAFRLGVSCITWVQGIEKDEGSIIVSRPVLGGKAVFRTALQIPSLISISPGAFDKSKVDIPSDTSVTHLDHSQHSSEQETGRIRNLGTLVSGDVLSGPSIMDAEVIVSAGRGIGKPENLDIIRHLAGMFERSAVAGSRAVVDAGWLPYSAQVGLTGKAVSPKLYIACGISGSPQHIAGIRNAKLIVAINKDPRAAIFNYAHYCITEDLFEFIPALIEELGK